MSVVGTIRTRAASMARTERPQSRDASSLTRAAKIASVPAVRRGKPSANAPIPSSRQAKRRKGAPTRGSQRPTSQLPSASPDMKPLSTIDTEGVVLPNTSASQRAQMIW